MREGWKEVELGELISTKKGYAFKSAWYQDQGVPVVRVSDFTDNSISYDNVFYINEDLALEHTSVLLHSKDIIVQTVGSWQHNPASIVGKVVRVPSCLHNSLLNQNAVKLIPNREVEKDFLYYRLKDESFKYHLLNFAQGAANQASITLETIKSFKVNIPPLETQKKIADILLSYDDLIENNLKRIKILEEMAQQTYEEWFVRMRFPGCESVIINKETGLPEGWGQVKLDDFARITFGYPFKANDFNTEKNGIPIIRIRNIPKSETSDYTTEIVDDKYIVNNGDILIGMDGEFYLNFWTGNKGYLVQRVCRLISNDFNNQGFLLEALRVPINYYQNSIDGATVAHLGKKHLDEIKIMLPNIDLSFFQNLMIQKINLSNQNQRLREARDILLPRLMMGMIEV